MKILYYYDHHNINIVVKRDIGYYYLNEDGILMNHYVYVDADGGIDVVDDMVISDRLIKSITSGYHRDHEISKEQYERITTRLLL